MDFIVNCESTLNVQQVNMMKNLRDLNSQVVNQTWDQNMKIFSKHKPLDTQRTMCIIPWAIILMPRNGTPPSYVIWQQAWWVLCNRPTFIVHANMKWQTLRPHPTSRCAGRTPLFQLYLWNYPEFVPCHFNWKLLESGIFGADDGPKKKDENIAQQDVKNVGMTHKVQKFMVFSIPTVAPASTLLLSKAAGTS